MAVVSMEVRNPNGGSFRQVLKTDDRYCNRDPYTIAKDIYGDDLISVNKPFVKKDLQEPKETSTFVSEGREIARPKRNRESVTKDFDRKSSKK